MKDPRSKEGSEDSHSLKLKKSSVISLYEIRSTNATKPYMQQNRSRYELRVYGDYAKRNAEGVESREVRRSFVVKIAVFVGTWGHFCSIQLSTNMACSCTV